MKEPTVVYIIYYVYIYLRGSGDCESGEKGEPGGEGREGGGEGCVGSALKELLNEVTAADRRETAL